MTKKLLKNLVLIAAFVIWVAIIYFTWWLFDPENFWQKLVMSFVSFIESLFLGVVLFIGSMLVLEEIDRN